jgi:hypothetical protein
MSTDSQKNLLKEYIERVWNRGDLTAFERLTTPSFTYRLGEQPPRDRAGMQQFLAMTRSAFPDWHVEIADIVVEWEQTDSLSMLRQLGALPAA